MRWRLAVLVVLAAMTLGYRGTSFYMRYFSPDLKTRATFESEYRDGAMVIKSVEGECAWPAGAPGPCTADPHPGDRIVGIYDDRGHGGTTGGLYDYGVHLKPIGATDPWTLVVERTLENGETRDLAIRMPPAVPIEWSINDWLINLGMDVYVPLLAMATGLLIGLLRPMNNQAFLAALVFLGFSAAYRQQVSQFPVGTRDVALFVATVALVFSPYLILRFFLRFPRPSTLDRKLPWLSPVLLAVTSVVAVVELVTQFTLHYSFASFHQLVSWMGKVGLTQQARTVFFDGFWTLLAVLSLASLAFNTVRTESRDDRRRMTILLAGAACGLVPPILLNLPGLAGKEPSLWLLLITIPALGLFPISFVYAVVKHRVFGIRLILRRGLQYALVSRGFVVVEGVVIFLALFYAAGPMLTRLFPQAGTNVASVGVAAVTVGLLAGTRRLNRRVLPAIDRRFFRDAYNTQHILTDLSRAVRELASHPDRLLHKAADEIVSALHPDHLAIFLAERPWPRLSPLSSPEPVCWEPAGEHAKEGKFHGYVHRTPARDGTRRARSAAVSGPVDLSSRLSVSDLLRTSRENGPEAMDVLPLNPEGLRADGSPPAVPPGECLWDRDLFHRYDARLVLPLVTAGKVLGFLVLGEKLSEEPYSGEDKELLLAVAEQMSIALDYSLLIGQVAEQEKLEREVQIAQDVQTRLFPRNLPAMRTLRYTGMCRAARGVGGDYYDFLRIGPDRLGLVLADIAGKGLPAALLMASLQALVRSQAPAHGNHLEELATEINRHLCESMDEARFATLFIGLYDDATRRLSFLNAGHNPPILVRRTSQDGGEAAVERLRAGGTVLGAFTDRTFRKQEVDLLPGDVLLVYSDGVTEAMNENEDLFGDEPLVDLVTRLASESEERIVERILAEVDRFAGSAPQQDDITLIAARVA